ncbi:MAG: NADH-quinone oxidoreductase subunit M, partial [Caulobacteraceae bacterium]
MIGLLSLTTFIPLVGVAAILILRVFTRPDDAKVLSAVKWIALASTLAALALAVLVLASFRSGVAGFQLVEDEAWFAGFHYRMGIDGISVFLILLTAFLMPLCIIASWKPIKTRVIEYMIA